MISLLLGINGELRSYDENLTHQELHIKVVEALRATGIYMEGESYIIEDK